MNLFLFLKARKHTMVLGVNITIIFLKKYVLRTLYDCQFACFVDMWQNVECKITIKSLVSGKRLITSSYLTYVAYIETLNNMVTFGWKLLENLRPNISWERSNVALMLKECGYI